jgi:hypothetical protein
MHIYFTGVDLETGFEALAPSDKQQRLVRGRRVARPNGWALFSHMRGQPIKCWCCGAEADQWIVEKHPKDLIGAPDCNLYASTPQGVVLMTRDHIIPKSLGGVDAVANLRPGCTDCNGERGNIITDEDIAFAKTHPELIDNHRVKKGIESVRRHVKQIHRENVNEIIAALKPYIQMGYL